MRAIIIFTVLFLFTHLFLCILRPYFLSLYCLLGGRVLIQLCRFQVYTSLTHCLYIALCSPPPVKSPSAPTYPAYPANTGFRVPPTPSLRPSPYCCVWVFFLLLNPFTLFTQLPNPTSPLTASVCSLYLSVCFYVILFCSLHTGPGQVAQLVSVLWTHQGFQFNPPSVHIQESTNECISEWNNKSMFLSLPLSLQINKLKK